MKIEDASKLQLEDLAFNVRTAKLTGEISDTSLMWSISVDAVPSEVEGETWRPRCYSESLLDLERISVLNWTDPFARPLTWTDGFDDRSGRPQAMFCVFEHTAIYNSTLRISTYELSSRISVDWVGKCDVHFGAYNTNLGFRVSTYGTFEGIIVANRGENLSPDQAMQKLRERVRQGDFVYHAPQTQYDFPMMKLMESDSP